MEPEIFTSLPHSVYDEAVEEIAKLHNLSDKSKYDVEYSAGSAKGDNYLGAMYRIGFRSRKDNSIKLSLIAKLSPQNEARRDEFQVNGAFEREFQFYNVLNPMYKEFQEKHGVDVTTEGFFEAPLVHLTLNEEPLEGIFFEDLKARNFEMFNRMKNFTKDHVMLVMKALAKMHAVFFCIKDQEPDRVKEFVGLEDFLLNITRIGKSALNAWYEGQKTHAFKALEKVESAELRKKVADFLNRDMLEMLNEIIGINVAEPYSTICHGDVWSNNMMFRNDQNGVPVEVSLLDFQIIRYASPVTDLAYHIFSSTTKELRDQHYREFLDTYYDTLANLIKRLNSDPEKLYPRRVFDDHLMRFGKFGIFMGVLALPAITASGENAPDLDSLAEQIKDSTNSESHTVDFKPSDKYEKRMIDVFEDIHKYGYI